MTPRLILLAASLAFLSGPALAADATAASDGAPVSTASQTTDQKIAAWLDEKPPAPIHPTNRADEPLRDRGAVPSDGKIHGEFGAGIGSGGYRSLYGVATIPIGKSASVTISASTGRGRYPWVAGSPWYYGPAGYDLSAECVCREAPDGSEQCRVAGAASRMDAELAEGACVGP
ncbi:MAG TPA: hypothetical protein VIJ94_03110 [Caulobacteraceae bacterium]